jgi:uncharacterized membrane protein YkgB
MDYNTIILIFTGVSFIAYGINSFISQRMINEFKRWGLNDNRKKIGASQFIAGFGLLIGFEFNLAGIISSIFIMLMMLVAIIVRIRIKDNISDILPAIAYLLLGGSILFDLTT